MFFSFGVVLVRGIRKKTKREVIRSIRTGMYFSPCMQSMYVSWSRLFYLCVVFFRFIFLLVLFFVFFCFPCFLFSCWPFSSSILGIDLPGIDVSSFFFLSKCSVFACFPSWHFFFSFVAFFFVSFVLICFTFVHPFTWYLFIDSVSAQKEVYYQMILTTLPLLATHNHEP